MTAFKKVTNKKVGELLIDGGVITRQQLEDALARKKETGKLLGEALVELGFASEEDVAGVVAAQYRIPYIPLKHHDVDKELLKVLPRDVAAKLRCFPVDRISTVLTIAMENPLDARALEEIQQATGARVLCYVSTPSEILAAIEQHYGPAGAATAPGTAASPAAAPRPAPAASPRPAAEQPGPARKEAGVEGGIKVFQLDDNEIPEG